MSAQCSLLPCDSYDYDKVYAALSASIQNLGGFGPYISPGERVLLKPNLLMKKRPEEAATTHPVFVSALASLLLEYGAKVVIGDSPGGPFTPALINSVYKATGMSDIAAAAEVTLNTNFNSFKKENPRGLIMKRLTLTDMLNDVDKVISVAKLKSHAMMTFTGAVKNMFGVVPGIVKAEYHLNIPNYEQFADMLIDVCLCSAPVLSFMDGIIGMEGHGPASGTPVDTHVILASDSPYHLDQAACHIIGLSVKEVPILKRLQEREMIGRLTDINFVGDAPDSFMMPSFHIVRGKSPLTIKDSNLPGFVKAFVGRHMQSRPVINITDCIGCGICKEACPAKVIDMFAVTAEDLPPKAGEPRFRPEIDYDHCIRCYCCQELCPYKAIKVYKPRMVKILRL